MLAVVIAGALAGLISAPHCALMCGPVGVHVSRAPQGLWRYQIGRATSYVIAGAIAGAFGDALITFVWGSPIASAMSWALALSFLLAAFRIWPRRKRAGDQLITLRKPPRPSLMVRVVRALPMRPEVIGAASVLLPCMALWAGLAVAASSGSPFLGAAAMLAFSATSGPGVLASGLLAKLLAKAGAGRRVLAAALVVGAVIIAMRPLHLAPSSEESSDAPATCPLHKAGVL